MKHLSTQELIEAMKKPKQDYCKLCGAAQIHDRNCPERVYFDPKAIAFFKESA